MKPLFLTAHYDDLEICAGGTAARYGGTSVVFFPHEDHGTEEEAEQAAFALGIDSIAAQRYVGSRGLVAWLDGIAAGSDTIISISPYDSHPEHQAVATIARQVARHAGMNLWFMDHAIPGGYPHGPRPNHFVNITGNDDAKYDAIECYNIITQTELRSIMYRDRYYGLTNGVQAAEGFIVENHIT